MKKRNKKKIATLIGGAALSSAIVVGVVAQSCANVVNTRVETVFNNYNRFNSSFWDPSNSANPNSVPNNNGDSSFLNFNDLVDFFALPADNGTPIEGTLAFVIANPTSDTINLGNTISASSSTTYFQRINEFLGFFPNPSLSTTVGNGAQTFTPWNIDNLVVNNETPSDSLSFVNFDASITTSLSEDTNGGNTITNNGTEIESVLENLIPNWRNFMINLFTSVEAFSAIVSLGILANALINEFRGNGGFNTNWSANYRTVNPTVTDVETTELFLNRILRGVLLPLIRNTVSSTAETQANYWNIFSGTTNPPFGNDLFEILTRDLDSFFATSGNPALADQFIALYQRSFFNNLPLFAGGLTSQDFTDFNFVPQLSLDINLDVVSIIGSTQPPTVLGNTVVNYVRLVENQDPITQSLFAFDVDGIVNPNDNNWIPQISEALLQDFSSPRQVVLVNGGINTQNE